MLTWSEPARSVWGKLDPGTNSWLPLVTHLEHAEEMAGQLWDHFLPAAIKQLLVADLGDADTARSACRWAAGVHDVGKCSIAFANQAERAGMSYVLDRMRDRGFDFVPVGREDNVRHETISQLAVRDWLQQKAGATRRVANTWAAVLGGHHGKQPTGALLTDAENRPHIVGLVLWHDVRVEILDRIAHCTGMDGRFPELVNRRLPVRSQVLLTAVVVVADWLSSNQDYFPYRDTLAPGERVREAFNEIGLPAPWHPPVPAFDAASLLRARFPGLGPTATAHPVQSAVHALAMACERPPLIIIEAPMGDGKTEGALMAAETLAARFGLGGVYVGLPTMATANPMFARVLDWLRTLLGEDASVALAHGKAGLNDRYAGLLHETWRGQVYDDERPEQGRPVVNGWLRGRRRAGLADFVVGTIDQGLFTALKAKHVALRHLGLAGKVVIVDEVHAADVYMREYLKRALAWLGDYQAPVILMSATLPPAQRDEYIAAYASGRGDIEPLPTEQDDRYPRITVYDGMTRTAPLVDKPTPHIFSLNRLPDDLRTLRRTLDGLLKEGGCAGVICNTVSRAQAAYRALREEFGDDTVLLHSRFIAPDRAQREQRLVVSLGRTGDQRPERLVVVGTQVLEQSLDVDFDIVVSDLAPMDLLFQRAGRLHRHARAKRPGPLSTPALYLRGVDDWAGNPPGPVRGSISVYGAAPLLRAAAVLSDRAVLTVPEDIPRLVREAYDVALQAPLGWESAWSVAERQAQTNSLASRQRAQAFLLPDPQTPENLTGLIDVEVSDPERSEEQGRSQVRDSEDSLEVIALWRDEEGSLRLPACSPRHPGALIPEGIEWGTDSERALAREMATCTLSLPITLTNEGTIGRVIAELERSVDYSGWQQSPWLRGQLVLVFGPQGYARVAGFDLHYTPEMGLVVTKEESK